MKNYLRYSFVLTLMVTLLVVLLRFIPEDSVRAVGLKEADILSDLTSGNTVEEVERLPGEAGAGAGQENILTAATPADSVPRNVLTTAPAQTPAEARPATQPAAATSAPEPPAATDSVPQGITPIIDYSPGRYMLPAFLVKLNNIHTLGRPVRIGFMGDSFIEGDLLTGDFRELMQSKYGGGGVGFVPITSQVAGFRQTVVHQFGDWEHSSIVYNTRKPFTISAYSYTPSEGSYVEYRGTKHKKHLDRFGRARLIYQSKGNSNIKARINGKQDTTFTTHPSDQLQEAVVEGDINRVRYTVNQVSGFTALGVFLENEEGVCVDNFSVRGNTGAVMTRISPELSEQFARLARYDLIVLEYGLNVVESDVTNYAAYKEQMTGVVNHLKACFPNIPILLMSVGDRATRRSGKLVTMPGILAMVKVQQEVAESCGILFWNTYEMMRSEGGMEAFVKKGWAAKDYTHIGAKGGRKIAEKLFEALITANE